MTRDDCHWFRAEALKTQARVIPRVLFCAMSLPAIRRIVETWRMEDRRKCDRLTKWPPSHDCPKVKL